MNEKKIVWPPKNADLKKGGSYYRKVSNCNLAQPYSKNTGRLLQRFEIIGCEFERVKRGG